MARYRVHMSACRRLTTSVDVEAETPEDAAANADCVAHPLAGEDVVDERVEEIMAHPPHE